MNTNLEDLPGEIWKDIPGYEGMYQISNMGRLKNLERKFWRNHSVTYKYTLYTRKENISKLHSWDGDYIRTTLYKNGIKKHIKLHRLVGQLFIPNPKNLPQINHKNGIRYDNKVENLEWCTNSENILHAYRIGLEKAVCGELHHNSVFKNSDIIKIRCMYETGNYSMRELAKKYNVDKDTIKCIVRRETWKHI